MATHDPEFYEAPKFSAEYDGSQPRQRGCFFYGCVIASVLIVLMIIALALVAYLAIRTANRYLEEYTATAPRAADAMLALVRNLHRLNILATYRILETSARTGS